ncbi:MAG TPA: glycosyltransferase [Solirubrobacteraceae bacterium]|nr:glycosyltransferase [Solirubrobacteraceae bacterium]
MSPPRRIFLGAFGQPGHAFPMLALGACLVRRGHAVAYETWERWRAPVIGAGMEFLPAPEYPVFPAHGQALGPYEAVARATPATRAAIAAWRPDIVVHDILTLAPALAAELEGIPTATLVPHLYPVGARGLPAFSSGARRPRTCLGRSLWGWFERPLEAGLRRGRDELNETRRRVGLAPTGRLHGGISPDLCLVATFPQLEYPRSWPPGVHVVGPLLWEPPGGPSAVPVPGPEPLVVVAPSTSHDPAHRLVRAALSGLARTEVRVLASLDRRAPAAPIRASRRARIVNWTSYAEAMDGASLVICHGGHGTLARALERGVPVLAVPHSGDMAENAARLDWAGVGLRLPWRLVSPTTVRLAVERALDQREALTARTRDLSAWAAEHDAGARAAELIEGRLTPGG